jgi:hypothetical protein
VLSKENTKILYIVGRGANGKIYDKGEELNEIIKRKNLKVVIDKLEYHELS